MKVPFVDLKRQYDRIKTEIDAAILKVVDESAFIGGSYLSEFETQFAAECGINHAIGVGNGTDALTIALRALGIGAGDSVLVPANSFIATSEAVTSAGARPIFVDCDPESYNIDVQQIEQCLNKRSRQDNIRAILPVHLYGRPAAMDQICALARDYNVKVVEDAAQAHFAELRGQRIGTFGDATTFSFYPGKNLGAYGDGGAVVTNDEELARRVRMIANHGRIEKYNHEIEGVNSRLDSLQAAVLSIKLKYIHDWNRSRNINAKLYCELLAGHNGIVLPEIPEDCFHVFHLFVVRVQNRTKVKELLAEKGISTGVHYPIALHNLAAYKYLGHKGDDFPVANRYQNEIMSLPMFAELSEDEIKYVANALNEAVK